MEYNLYLDYKASMDLNLSDYSGGIFEHVFADIMYAKEEVSMDEEDDDDEEKKIGFMSWIECNQVLAETLSPGPEQFHEDPGPDSYYGKRGVDLSGLESDPEKAQWKLNAFFQRCGFQLLKNYDNVFVCNIEKVVPGHIGVKWPQKRPI